jgi:hypothetical protein
MRDVWSLYCKKMTERCRSLVGRSGMQPGRRNIRNVDDSTKDSKQILSRP